MDFDSIGAFAMFISGGAIGIGLVYLAGYKMKLKAELEKLRLRGNSHDGVDDLRDEVQQALARQAAEIEELSERIDFTERLLTKDSIQRDELNTPTG